jgi:hypothetical protein
MKLCKGCNTVKSESDFYKDNRSKTGLSSACKECQSKRNKASRNKNLDYYRSYYNYRYSVYKQKAYDDAELYKVRHPEKLEAKKAVQRALKNQEIVKGKCAVCGECNVDAHHEDYSKPLDVIWLCRKHHIDLHAKRIKLS